jgi:hypothetical protein
MVRIGERWFVRRFIAGVLFLGLAVVLNLFR